jgi:3-deoxy-D-manno-octulosonic-acid transferase
VALPVLAGKSLRTGKYRADLPARFGVGELVLPQREKNTRVLMMHCVSVGELNSVTTLIERLLATDPDLHVVVTTTTDTGTERARKIYGATGANNGRVHTARFAFDFSFAVERLLDRIRPDAVALVELETWPNFLDIAESRRIPVAIINGRISERSFPRYRLVRPVMASMLRKVSWIGVQTEAIAGRFRLLGAREQSVEVLPTLKYDNAPVGQRIAGQEALAAAMGLLPEHLLFVAGSTGPGEQEAVLEAYGALREKFPMLRLAIAPRHPEVVPEVVASIQRRGLVAVMRSERPDGGQAMPLKTGEVFVLNTMGELRKLYALSLAAFVGRSLQKVGGGGSDMIEVAALGRPSCFGPFTANFAEAVELLVQNNAATVVRDGVELRQAMEGWLADPAAALAVGLRAQDLIRRQQGSTARYVERLMALVRAGGDGFSGGVHHQPTDGEQPHREPTGNQ